MRTGLIVALVLVGVIGLAQIARAESVTVNYEATAVTVVNSPFGLTVPRLTTVTGYFTFETSTVDEEDEDPEVGLYRHDGGSAFLAGFLENEITGSSAAVYEFRVIGGSFSMTDGPGTFGDSGGVMSLDGSPDADIDLFFSASPGDLADDSFFNPFPFFDFESHVGTPHTFSLKDDQGTMLLQMDHVQTVGASTTTTTTTLPANECGDPTGSGITASDALFALKAAVGSGTCATCLCDVDGNGAVAASDALVVLKIATGQQLTLACPAC